MSFLTTTYYRFCIVSSVLWGGHDIGRRIDVKIVNIIYNKYKAIEYNRIQPQATYVTRMGETSRCFEPIQDERVLDPRDCDSCCRVTGWVTEKFTYLNKIKKIKAEDPRPEVVHITPPPSNIISGIWGEHSLQGGHGIRGDRCWCLGLQEVRRVLSLDTGYCCFMDETKSGLFLFWGQNCSFWKNCWQLTLFSLFRSVWSHCCTWWRGTRG